MERAEVVIKGVGEEDWEKDVGRKLLLSFDCSGQFLKMLSGTSDRQQGINIFICV